MGTPLVGLDADVWVSSSASVNLASPETCDNTDAGTYIAYKTHTHAYWDKRQTLTVQCSPNGSSSWATVTDYTFRYVGGLITFNTARVAGVNNYVRVSGGYYFNVSQLGECHTWTLEMKANSVDTSIFQGNAWGRKTGTQKTATGTIGTFRTDSTLASQLSNLMIFSLYVDKSANKRWELAGYLSGVNSKASMDGVLVQDVDFAADGEVWFYAS